MANPRDYKTRKAKRSPYTGWLGLAVGLALGLAIAAVVYLKDHKFDAPAVSAVKVIKKRTRGDEPPDAPEAGAAEPAQPSYDFYSRLPKFEVVVPEKDRDVRPDIKPAPETRRGTYMLQVGSYKNFADAERVRAQLALQGVEARVEKVSVDNDTWHRIRIGPISDLAKLNRMRALLRRADKDALVIRVGD